MEKLPIKMEKSLALLFSYACKDFESWDTVIVFSQPGQKIAFKIIDFNNLDKFISSDMEMVPAEAVVVNVNLHWFWMSPFAPEDIRLDFTEALSQALLKLKVKDKKEFEEKREEVERLIEKKLINKLGKKSTIEVALNNCFKIILPQCEPKPRTA